MAKQLVPNTAAFRVIQRYVAAGTLSAEVVNTFYVRNVAILWNATTLGAMATTIGNAFRDQVMPNMMASVTLDRVDAEDLGADPGDIAIVEYNTAGGDLGAATSSVLAVLITLTGNPNAFPRKGRLYLVGGSVNAIIGNQWTQGLVDSYVNAIGTIQTQIQGGANAQVLVSRFLNKVKRSQGVTNQITGRSGRRLVATQRDRRV